MNATQQKFKPILFSTEMVQAILAGRKTQTRRIAPFDKFCTKPFKTGNGKWQEHYNNNPDPNKMFPDGWMAITNYKSKYQPGDILWVRETSVFLHNQWIYKADNLSEMKLFLGWKPSIFMPKEACRIFLKVTNVRVERLQDISEEDAIAEGCKPVKHYSTGKIIYQDHSYYTKNPRSENGCFDNAKQSFETLWQSINAKKHPWESNPWVWVYEFERIEKPENFN